MIRLYSIEDVQATIQILVFPEIEVDRVEYEPDGDIAVECGNEEPRAEVITWDEPRYALPDLGWGALRGRFVDEVDLRAYIHVSTESTLGCCLEVRAKA